MWQSLRRGRTAKVKFRRQHAIDRFIVDFYCVQARLVIEIDGPIHDSLVAADRERQDYLESLGLKVVRFSNAEVLDNVADVVSRIEDVVGATLAEFPSPRKERG